MNPCQPKIHAPVWSTKTKNVQIFFKLLVLMVLRSSPSGRATQWKYYVMLEKRRFSVRLVLFCSGCDPNEGTAHNVEQKRFCLLTVSGNRVWWWPHCTGTRTLMARDRTEVIPYFQNSFWLLSVDRELHCSSQSLYFIFPGVATLAVASEQEVSYLLASFSWFLFCFVLSISFYPD